MQRSFRSFKKNGKELKECSILFNPLVPGDFFFSLLMKVHTEVHYGNRLGNPKYQVSAFIHYQDMEIFNFSVFLTMQLYFPTNCFQILPV